MNIHALITPVNQEEEKAKFFFDVNYNPQFMYEEKITHEDLTRYGLPSEGTFEHAKQIMDTVIHTWKDESTFLKEVEGRVLGREEATRRIQDYLKKNNLEDKVTLKFSPLFVPRTSVNNYTMYIRLPIDYHDLSLEGILNHEVGTHIFRRLNDDQQPWSNEDREKYDLIPNMETEEGLAVLHTCLESKIPHLWLQSVRYYATFRAQTISFSELYNELKKYIDDKGRRWNTCLRAKRGLTDTSQPGGYTKDKGYLEGAMRVGDWLQKNDYDLSKLYLGKIALEDVEKAWKFNPTYVPVLPPFYTQNPKQYKLKIREILKLNRLI